MVEMAAKFPFLVNNSGENKNLEKSLHHPRGPSTLKNTDKIVGFQDWKCRKMLRKEKQRKFCKLKGTQ